MDREDIRLAVRNIRNLPTLPTVVTRILEAAQDKSANAKQVAEIVSNDQSISAKVLQLANSAFYGFSRQITTITQTVVILGFDTVRSLALSVSTFNTLSQNLEESNFDRGGFWLHSIGCGVATRPIAKKLGIRDAGTLFVAGILHDLGKVILDNYFREPYELAVQKMKSERRAAHEVEMEIMNIDHAEVGGWLASRWHFPPSLIVPVQYHHDPLAADEEYRRDAMIVHLANIMAKQLQIGVCYEAEVPDPDEAILNELNLTPDDIQLLLEELEGAKEEIDEFFKYLHG